MSFSNVVARAGLAVSVLALPVAAFAQVSYERIENSASEPDSWLTYSGNFASHRHTSLVEISPENVADLRPLWIYQTRGSGRLETSPLVVDGVMYLTEAPARVVALDVHTGRPLWDFDREMPRELKTIGFPRTNRGLAILGDTLYFGTLDASVIALDSRTGAVRWEENVEDNALGYSITAAPLAVRDKIIVGISGGEAGVRGFLDAYHATTGERLWRRYMVPGPGEPGHDSWEGDSWKTGGGATWLTGSFDPDTNLLVWGTGNPAPDWNGDDREGDNLYTCSLVAIDADSGEIAWHFQFTPHDVHDWDANQIPVLLDAEIDGRQRKLVALANRNAFYYLLDRVTGEFLLASEYSKQTWAKEIDENGRPVLLPNTTPYRGREPRVAEPARCDQLVLTVL